MIFHFWNLDNGIRGNIVSIVSIVEKRLKQSFLHGEGRFE